MDQKKLFKSVVKQEVRAQQEHDSKVSRQEREKQEAKLALEKRQAPVDILKERHATAMHSLESFLKVRQPNEWSIYDEDGDPVSAMKGILVVLDDAPKSDVTPNHVAICLATTQQPVRWDDGKPKDKSLRYATFTFAFIPRSSLEAAIAADGYPLSEVSADELIRRDESSRSAHDLARLRTRAQEPFSNRHKRSQYHQWVSDARRSCVEFERNLDWITAAAANPELNPHLQFPVQNLGETALQPTVEVQSSPATE